MRQARIVGFLTICFLAAAPVVGNDPAVGPEIAKDIRGIRTTLDSIAATQQKQFRTDLILKRLELQERRLDPLAQRLAGAEIEYQNIVDTLDSLQRMKDQIEARLQEEIQQGADTTRSETRLRLDEVGRSIEVNTEREREALLRVREAEDRMTGLLEKIEILDDMFEQLLEEFGR